MYSRTWDMIESHQNFMETCNRGGGDRSVEISAPQALTVERDRMCTYTPGGAVSGRPGAGCFPPSLVAWRAAVPTLASPGTPLTAATQSRGQIRPQKIPPRGGIKAKLQVTRLARLLPLLVPRGRLG